MRSSLSLSAIIAVAATVITPALGSPVKNSSIAHRDVKSPIGLYEPITEYMWNYAGYQINIGQKGGVGAFHGKGYDHFAPIRLAGAVGTDGVSMTGTAFLLEFPKQFGPKSIGYETLLYDYQYLRPTNGSILPPLTQGLAEAILKDINIAKEIRRLPGISSSEKEDLIDRLGPDGTLIYPHGTSDEVIDKVQAVIQKYHDRKFAKFIIDFLNKILDRMINLGKKYGVSEYGIIERLQSRGNVIASFIGHAVKPPSQDGIVRSNIHGGGLNGEIVMWSEGLSLWMNLRLVSDDGPNDRRNVDTGDVKLFTLNCSGGKKPMYCNPNSRGNGIIHLGRFTRFVTAFF